MSKGDIYIYDRLAGKVGRASRDVGARGRGVGACERIPALGLEGVHS